MAKTLEKEAQEKIAAIEQQQTVIQQNIETYNQSVLEVNLCLERMLLDRKKLPQIQQSDLALTSLSTVTILQNMETPEIQLSK